MKPFSVRVPASTSNLGSGFDTVSAALSLHLKIDVAPGGGGGFEWVAGWDSSHENILDRALEATFAFLDVDPPPLELRMDNPIPLRRGLGSSGAAIVAGIKIAAHVCGADLSADQVLKIGYPLEGHPDNLAASLRGGWVLSRVIGDSVLAERIDSPLRCRFVLAIPEATVSTREARAILPSSYPLPDAVFNLQRCALLVHALHTGRADLIREAVRDRLHQPYRSRLAPGLGELLERAGLPAELEDDLWSVSISGSGTAVIAIAGGRWDAIGEWMVGRFRAAGMPARHLVLDLDRDGARVLAEGESSSGGVGSLN